MSIIKSYGSGDATGGFYTKTLANSLRFNEGPNANTTDSSYLTRAAVTPTNAYKWTLSVWIKRSVLHAEGSSAGIISSSVNGEQLTFSNDNLQYQHYASSATRISIITNNAFRDTSNWYHVVCAVDHSNSTTDDKAIIYVNGVRQTLSTNTIASGTYNSTLLTATNTITIGKERVGSHFTGYMAEMHFVDGQQLTPTTFGETKQGIWIPKTVSNLTYGNNGFYLDFGNSSAIGEDNAGSNDYTTYYLNSWDIVPDSPTNNFATALSSLSEPQDYQSYYKGTYSEGNLKVTGSSSGWTNGQSNFGMTSGKWYAECIVNSWTSSSAVRIGLRARPARTYDEYFVLGDGTGQLDAAARNGRLPSFTTEDVIQFALDLENNAFYLGVNGTWGNSATATEIANGTTTNAFASGAEVPTGDGFAYFFYAQPHSTATTITWNFGQDDTFANVITSSGNTYSGGAKFKHPPPTGFLALNSNNLPDVTLSANEDEQPNDHFQNKVYTGSGSSFSVTGINFKPDFTWIKNITDSSTNHVLVDSSRGSAKELQLPSTAAETTNGWISAFTADGFTHTAQSGATQQVVFDAYVTGSGGNQRWRPKVPSGISIQIGSTTYNAGDNISVADTTTIFGAYGVNTRNVAWTNGGNASYYGASAGNQNVNPSATNVSPYLIFSHVYQISSPNCRYYGARFNSDGSIQFIIYYREYVDDEYGAYCGTIQSTQGETGVISSITAVNINVTSGASTYDPVNKNNSKYATWNWKGSSDTPTKTYTVKVVSDSGNKYRFDDFGTSAVTLDLQEGGTYTFDVSDSSMSSHPFVIGTAANSSEYSTGVTYQLDGSNVTYSAYTSGFSSATTRKLIFTVPSSAPALYYWCSVHSGMGGAINTNTTKGSSNFAGSIQSKVQSNPTAGFSIVTYTGNGTAGATIGHELGVKPAVIIIKRRTGAVQDWMVYHHKNTSDPATDYLSLNRNLATQDTNVIWNDTEPNTSVITLGGHDSINQNTQSHIAFVFAEIAGYSKFGSYEGNNSSTDNAFVFTGFLPSFVAIKNIDAAEDWTIRDIEHSGYYTDRANPIPIGVQPSTSTNATGGSAFNIDFVSNGFKVRGNNADVGASNTYVYLAFASNPFKFSNAR